MNRLFLTWLLITFIIAGGFTILDSIFDKETQISFFEAGFLSFVAVWCDLNKGRKQ